MIKLSKHWSLQWPLVKMAEIEIDLDEALYNAVVESMTHKSRGEKQYCHECGKRVGYVVRLKDYNDFVIICKGCYAK